jgi:hypothetical protein
MNQKTPLLFLIASLLITVCFAQEPQQVTFKIKNNGLVPREFRFLERRTDGKYPNVFTAYLLPGQSYAVTLKVGTMLSQVTQSEINATMKGDRVEGKDVLVVKEADQGRTIDLFPPQRAETAVAP